MQLSEINERLRLAWGLDIVIDAEGARSFKFVSDRGRFIEAVEAGPSIPDADHYVRRALREAGYTVAELGGDPDEGGQGVSSRPNLPRGDRPASRDAAGT